MLSKILDSTNACEEAREWALRAKRTPRQAWEQCPRADWLLWYASRVEVDRKLLVLAACDCARTSLRHVPTGEERPRIAIETAERWARGVGGVTLEDVRKAADDAAAAYAAAAYAAAAAAAQRRALKRMALLVRKRIPYSTVLSARRTKMKGGAK